MLPSSSVTAMRAFHDVYSSTWHVKENRERHQVTITHLASKDRSMPRCLPQLELSHP